MKKKHRMYSKLALASLVCLSFVSLPAQAGKVDEVKKAIKDKCSKELSDSEVTDAVVKAYDCAPESEVKIADCAIKCLRGGSGAVVGGK